MKLSDKILIAVLILANTIFLLNTLKISTASTAIVYLNNTQVQEIDLTQDATYSIEGTNGEVEVTVENGLVAITNETSPQNICSKQGFVNINKIPLICLPNNVVVESSSSELDGVAR